MVCCLTQPGKKCMMKARSKPLLNCLYYVLIKFYWGGQLYWYRLSSGIHRNYPISIHSIFRSQLSSE